MSEPKKLTIIEARSLLNELQKAAQWIESIIDEDVRRDLEVNIEEPPVHIRELLEKEQALVKQDINYLSRMINRALEVEPMIDVTMVNYRRVTEN